MSGYDTRYVPYLHSSPFIPVEVELIKDTSRAQAPQRFWRDRPIPPIPTIVCKSPWHKSPA